MVNNSNGNGIFTVDRDNRATRAVLQNQPPDGSQYWGWDGGHFVDVDNDGDLDLALGQIRDRGPPVFHQRNTVLVNDGTGYFQSPHRPAARALLRGLHGRPLADPLRRERRRVRGPAADAHPQRRRQPQRRRLHGALHPGARQPRGSVVERRDADLDRSGPHSRAAPAEPGAPPQRRRLRPARHQSGRCRAGRRAVEMPPPNPDRIRRCFTANSRDGPAGSSIGRTRDQRLDGPRCATSPRSSKQRG